MLSVTQNLGVVKRIDVGIDIKYDPKTLKNYKIVDCNDFVISLRSFQGGFELSNIKGIVSPAYTVFRIKRPESNSHLFWKSMFKRYDFIQSLKIITFGIRDGKSISFAEFKTLKIVYPLKYIEQEKIGKLINKINDLIYFQEQQLSLYRRIKDYFLQRMFASDRELAPKVRFADFHGNWEQHTLGGLVSTVKSYPLTRIVERPNITGYKYIHYGDIHTKKATIINNENTLPNIEPGNYDLLNLGDVIVADASEDYAEIAEPSVLLASSGTKVVAGLHTIAMRPQKISSLFLYYKLHTDDFKKYGRKTGTGLKVFGITSKNLYGRL